MQMNHFMFTLNEDKNHIRICAHAMCMAFFGQTKQMCINVDDKAKRKKKQRLHVTIHMDGNTRIFARHIIKFWNSCRIAINSKNRIVFSLLFLPLLAVKITETN